MRVLVVMTARELGGAEFYVERLVGALSDRCRFSVVLSHHPNIVPLRRRLEAKADVLAVDFDHPSALPGVVRTLRRLAAQHDIVHLNSNHPASRLGILLGFALPGGGTPVVAVEQGVSPIDDIIVPKAIAWTLPTLFRWSRRRVALTIAVSRQNQEMLVDYYRLPASHIAVVNNGADLAPYSTAAIPIDTLHTELKLAGDRTIVITLARLAPNKGHRYIVEAAPLIVARHPGVHFVFAGVLDQADPVRLQIERGSLSKHFTLLGFRSDVANLLAGSDIFVLPSLGEGFSLSIVEAMAAGLAVVATRVGGAEEIIVDGQNGFLVPPADAGALAAAIIRVLNMDPSARSSLQQSARIAAARFSVQAMADRTFALYQQVASRSRLQVDGN